MSKPVVDSALYDERAITLNYLEQHPDLLLHYPGLLAKLEIPHGHKGGTISLVERQIAVLRDQLDNERRRLLYLIERAREYERLTSQLHRLTTQLILARTQEQARTVIYSALRHEFHVDAVVLKLFPVSDAPSTNKIDATIQSFLEFVDRDRCLCGPLNQEQFVSLFGAEGSELQSAALIPLKGAHLSGVLAIGSRDPERFTVDMATDVLSYLGAITSAKLMELNVSCPL